MTPAQELIYASIARNARKLLKNTSPGPDKAMLFNFAYQRLVIMRQECRSIGTKRQRPAFQRGPSPLCEAEASAAERCYRARPR